MRLDKFLATTGFGSRKDVKTLCKKGKVCVNGNKVKDPSIHIDENNDEITVFGDIVTYAQFHYFMLNKPQDVVSATTDKTYSTVIDLLAEEYCNTDLFPVGRLDIDTEGLMILTNDGKLAHKLLSPRHKVAKTYFVKVNREIEQSDIEDFRRGVIIYDKDDNPFCTAPAIVKVSKDDKTQCTIEITEGKFHQVKRMFEKVGKRVEFLKRVRFGGIDLDNELEVGDYRPLSEEEIKILYQQGDKDAIKKS